MLGPMKKIKKEHWELNKQQIRLKKTKIGHLRVAILQTPEMPFARMRKVVSGQKRHLHNVICLHAKICSSRSKQHWNKRSLKCRKQFFDVFVEMTLTFNISTTYLNFLWFTNVLYRVVSSNQK